MRMDAASIRRGTPTGLPTMNLMTWLHKARLRALAWLLGTGLAAFGAVALASWPVWPVVGVAVAAAVVGINRIAGPLKDPICRTCGASLAGEPIGAYGAACPGCGSVNQGWVGRRGGVRR